jgi:dolichol-phosphate mannosyltransferase
MNARPQPFELQETRLEPAPEIVEAPLRRRPLDAPFAHHYDVHGLVAISSDVRLPELAFFRTATPAEPDILVRRGGVGQRRPRRSLLVERGHGCMRYHEHLGRYAANFSVEFGPPISVTVGPMLAASPHVVYTNIVEALLRFVLVSRGMILLHSASMVINGRGVMLSAQTDTGKTTTVLRLLRDHGGVFLADDMTIVDTSGGALGYPKPLTISAHTVQAVNRRALRLRERAALALQSRIHSKGGRSVGQRLGDMNLPIMSINACTQMLVPPPKYGVQRLVPCEIGRSAQMEFMFVIERGPRRRVALSRAEAVETLLANTADAYGFPPFRYFAPAIAVGNEDYHALRARERDILGSALRRISIERIARDDFSWSDAIPELLVGPRSLPDQPEGRAT